MGGGLGALEAVLPGARLCGTGRSSPGLCRRLLWLTVTWAVALAVVRPVAVASQSLS